MLIAHISDFHIFTETSETSLVRPDIIPVVRRIIDDVAAFRPAVDAVMLTGDLADGGTMADYATVRELLKPLPMPFFAVPGNHDKREAFRAAFADLFPFEDGRFALYETEFRGIRILGFDTLTEPGPGGALCRERLAWIERKLSQPWEGATILLMHHAPYLTGIRFLDGIGLASGRRELGEIVARYKGELRILAGHIHRPSQCCWNGALVTIAGSAAFKIELDLHPDHGSLEPPQADEPYAYFIHHVDVSGDVAVHPRYVRLPEPGKGISHA